MSALLWGGKPAAIIQAAEDGKVRIFISESIAAEIGEVLAYPKLEKIYRQELRREDLVAQVLKNAKFVKAPSKVQIIQEHPADNKFLDCALAADADCVVSGDKHLLKVVSFKKTKILTVSDFLKSIQ
ncbi:MAG: putative toxin-antitoxin system toxin component, PIN family [Candidatus Bathyarchaeota archaeon]|nr:putative toxin-antitoxin system toxin component, PIN family [Chloroflexota bacterium]MCL5876847.1 putative toxin-antitoxin system toxin component, PIN family [Candidatus Bathyarchaeota archaeon]